ncbi:MAG: lamin tail domain-containing protein [Candidatus Levyibacteriota bacterium]
MLLKCLFVIILCLIVWGFVKPSFADQAIAINEVLVHPSSGHNEWVELYVPDGTSVINDWIDDDSDFVNDAGSSSKKQITAVVAGSDAQHVVFELPSAMFNNDGDIVALFSADGQLIDQYQYTKDPGADISMGRTPDASGGFSTLANATRGSANSIAKPTPTPTPGPTTKPTKEPKTTSAPTTTKNSADTLLNNPSSSLIAGDETSVNASDISESEGSTSAQPTSILGVATKVGEQKKAKPTPQVMVKGSSNGTLPLVLTSFGGLFLLACGILIYLKKKGIWN